MHILATIEVDKDSSVFILNLQDNIVYIDTSIIPKEQLKEINQYHQIQDRNKRLISRTFLFKHLKEKQHLFNFEFSYTDIKRPTLKQTDVDFNISYSKDLIAVAVSTKNRIGVDIEYIDKTFDISTVIPTCMNSDELKIFESLENDEGVNYFYSLWTYKEALSKLLGGGLHLNLKEIENNEHSIHKYQPIISSDYCCSIVRFN